MSLPTARMLHRSILRLFIGVYLFGLVMMMSLNVIAFGQSLQSMMGFWMLQMLGLGVILVAPGFLVSLRLLKPLRGWLMMNDRSRAELASAARRAVFRYPWQGIIFFAVFGVVGSGLFHLTQALHDYGTIAAEPGWWEVTSRIYLEELSLSIALGIVFFVLARRALRRFLMVLPAPSVRDTHRLSVRLRFALTLVVLLVHNSMVLLAVYLNGIYFREPLRGIQLALLVGESLFVSIGIGLIAVSDLSSDLNQVTKGLVVLGQSNRIGLRQPLPITTDDEIGDLVLAFNALQVKAQTAAEEMEQELELARRIQTELLPRLPYSQIGGYRIAGFSLPAREVGGDFYDLLDLGNGRVGIAIGDATGKGVPAAMLMSATVAFLRSEAYAGEEPGQVVARLNQLLAATIPAGFFVTLLYMVVDTQTGRATYSSAGHLDPLLIRRGREQGEYLPVGSLPLGIDPQEVYSQQDVLLTAGTRLVLYTDGVIEIHDSLKSSWGFEGFSRLVEKLCRENHPEGLITQLKQEIRGRIGDAHADDDLTIVVLEMPEDHR